TVAPVAGLGAHPPELVDKLARRRREAAVEIARDGSVVVSVRERELAFPHRVFLISAAALDPDRAQHRVVEQLGRGSVGRADRDVVEHFRLNRAAGRRRGETVLHLAAGRGAPAPARPASRARTAPREPARCGIPDGPRAGTATWRVASRRRPRLPEPRPRSRSSRAQGVASRARNACGAAAGRDGTRRYRTGAAPTNRSSGR